MKKLNFLRYRIERLALDQPDEYSGELSVSLTSNVDMISENKATVSLQCLLKSEDELFTLALGMSGDFEIEDNEDEDNIPGLTNEILLSHNSLSILFPYLRATVSQVTSIGYQSPIVLPPINVLDFINKSKEEEPEK